MDYQNISDKTAKSYLQHGLERTDLRFLDQLLTKLNGQSSPIIKAINQAGKEDLLVPAVGVLKEWVKYDRLTPVGKVCRDIRNCDISIAVIKRTFTEFD